MSIILLFLCLFAGSTSAAVGGGLVSFPYASSPCSCVSQSCTCCTGVRVPSVGFKKTVCVVLGVNTAKLQVDVSIQLDNKILSQFSFIATNPPQYCIPLLLPISLSMCLKLHDVTVASGPNIQICMTLYAGFAGKNNYVVPFNCIKITSGSMQYFTTTTTTQKPGKGGATTTTTVATPTKAVATTTAATTTKSVATTTTTTTTPATTTTTTATRTTRISRSGSG